MKDIKVRPPRNVKEVIVHMNSGLTSRWTIGEDLQAFVKPYRIELADKFHQILGIVEKNCQITGNQARKLFDSANVDKVLQCLNENVSSEDKRKFKQYLEGLCYFHSVFRSNKPKQEFNMDEFDRKQIEFQVFLRKELPWVEPGRYLHIGLCHAGEILRKHESIGTHSTEATEGKNKEALWLAQNLSRRTDTWKLARDILLNDHLLSSPLIQESGIPRPIRRCRNCHEYRKNYIFNAKT